jgi:hypothetical protein
MSECAINVLQNEQADGPAPIPTTDRMVFIVPSGRDSRVRYRVDLLANLGAGWCQCPDFAARKQPNLDAGMTTWMAATSCKHTRRAMRYVMRRTLGELANRESVSTHVQP